MGSQPECFLPPPELSLLNSARSQNAHIAAETETAFIQQERQRTFIRVPLHRARALDGTEEPFTVATVPRSFKTAVSTRVALLPLSAQWPCFQQKIQQWSTAASLSVARTWVVER